jgi:hypothetical protein
LTKRINDYIDNPWNDTAVALWRDRAKTEREENEVLQAAAAILRRDLVGWGEILGQSEPGGGMHRGATQKIAELEVTIGTLEEPRGVTNHPGFTARISDLCRSPKPWAMMAAGIGDELHRVLHSAGDPRAGIGGADSPFTRSIKIFLGFIIGRENTPQRSTINEALENHLASSLKYRRGG